MSTHLARILWMRMSTHLAHILWMRMSTHLARILWMRMSMHLARILISNRWDLLSRPPLLLLLVQQRTSCRVLGSRQAFYPLVFNGHLLLIYLLFTTIRNIPYPPLFNKNSGRQTVREECRDMYAVALLWRFSLSASAPLKTSIITASLNCSVLEKIYVLTPFKGMSESLLVR